jgi:DNA-binding response OmpR family regulator
MKTILLVEDDPSIQDAMQLIFQEPEYQLFICCNGEEALFENKIVPDIYLIDKQLSGFDGLELCRLFKTNEQTKAIPVVLLSASPNIHKLALEAGADDAVEKPFKIELLQETIARLIS